MTAGTVTSSTAATLTASYSGVNATFGVTITPAPAVPNITSTLSVNPSTIVSGNSGIGTITLPAPAGSGGVTVALSSSNPTAAHVRRDILIPQGSSSATFNVTAGSVATPTPATLTASYPGLTATFDVTINPPPPALSSVLVAPKTIVSGQSGIGTVSLTAAAGTGGVVVSLSSSNATAASLPPTVTVPQGSTSATFTVTTGTISASTRVTLTASYLGVSKTFRVVVDP